MDIIFSIYDPNKATTTQKSDSNSDSKEQKIMIFDKTVVTDISFIYDVFSSEYAKGSQDTRSLVVKGSLTALIDFSPELLEYLRKWTKEEYNSKTEDSYYRKVNFTCIHADMVVRKITFENAYVRSYTEEIDVSSGHGIFWLTLEQKASVRNKILIEPSVFELKEVEEE